MSLYIGSDMDVALTGMRDAITGVYLNSATATYDLKQGNTVLDSGTLAYVSASSGNYLAVIDASVTANLVKNASYMVVITFVQGEYKDVRYLPQNAYYRGNN